MWFSLRENAVGKGGQFRLAETRAAYFDKKESGGKDGQFRLAETRAAYFDKKESGTRIASRFSLVGRVVSFDWLKREPFISIKKEPGTRIASRLSLVGRMVSFDWLKRELLISIKKSLERELRPDSVWWEGWSVSIG
ncbi:MAG: hypothetical protein UEP78_07315 [Negativibacillus sp.]|nr:hypothetical protein [Negativibacillus sp.]